MILKKAHELAGLSYPDGFCTNFNSSMVNNSGIRSRHYAKSKELATFARLELERNLTAVVVKTKLKRYEHFTAIPKPKRYNTLDFVMAM
jgi:hypothetical protein